MNNTKALIKRSVALANAGVNHIISDGKILIQAKDPNVTTILAKKYAAKINPKIKEIEKLISEYQKKCPKEPVVSIDEVLSEQLHTSTLYNILKLTEIN